LPVAFGRCYVGNTMTDNLTTKPTLDTLMDMMRELRDGVAKMEAGLNVRLDRIESEVKLTHSEF